MKTKIVILSFIALFSASILIFSCTDNQRAKLYGGDAEVELPKGQKLITATWKETSLWYLTRKMTPSDSAERYSFKEESSLGIVEGEVTFIESK